MAHAPLSPVQVVSPVGRVAPRMRLPAITEKEFQRQVTDLAEILGWLWVHHRPAQTNHGWRTPVSGQLGAGWVDLVLVHPGRPVLFRELKRNGQGPDPAQQYVLDRLKDAGADASWWSPADLDSGRIQRELAG